jgi:hypothetical protein
MRTFFCVCLLAAYSMLNTCLAGHEAAPPAATEKSDRGEGRGGGGGGGG